MVSTATPTRKFNGVTAHPELFEMVSKGEVSAEMAWLSLVISSYVGYKQEGCWATDETLAQDIGKSIRQTQLLIKRLRGWQQITKKNGVKRWRLTGPRLIRTISRFQDNNGASRRVLETKWSRVDPTVDWDTAVEQELEDKGGGEIGQKAGPGRGLPVKNNGEGVTLKITGRLPVKNNGVNSKKVLKGEKAASPPVSSPHFKLKYDGKLPPNNGCRSPKGFTAPSDICLKWHDKLQGILRSRGPAHATKSIMRHKGAESFATLLKDIKDRQQIDNVLAAYATYADQITEPDITSIHDFCRIGIYRWLLRILRTNGWLDEQPIGGSQRVVWTTVDGKTRAEIVDE